ncbi:beta-propeller fold lactonase family protein [Knoellia sp. S7-12]|uniref:lactonase family protein n=1 Tax=Knoellia sp. S7-12 TaxID=3126698 RepID=UPI0033692BBF
MNTESGSRWVAIASAPPSQTFGTVTLHPWDGAHDIGAAVATLELERPSWLTWAPDGRHLHVACEAAQGHVVTLLADLTSGGTPTLAEAGRAGTGGISPCHLALLPDGDTLVVANYSDGTVSTLEVRDGVVTELADVDRLTGSGPHPSRQESSHAHQVVPLSGERVCVVDLGADKIVTYAVRNRELHRITSSAMPAGAGPRHVVRDPRTRRAWLGGELSGSLIALRERDIGEFEVVGETVASANEAENSVAHIWLDASGQRLLISNRGPDTVSLFDVSAEIPQLLGEVSVPAHPRHFHVEGATVLVAGRDADAVTTHTLEHDGVSAAITTLTVPAPMCIVPTPTRPWASGSAEAGGESQPVQPTGKADRRIGDEGRPQRR